MLLTRAPLSSHPKTRLPFDLHVLGTPPAFILSQDQTLRMILTGLLSFMFVLTSSSLLFFFRLHSSVVNLRPALLTMGGVLRRM